MVGTHKIQGGRRMQNNLKALIIRRRASIELATGKPCSLEQVHRELAAYCGISKDHVVGVKRGNTSCSIDIALYMADYFQVPVEEIFSLPEEMKGRGNPVPSKKYKPRKEEG